MPSDPLVFAHYIAMTTYISQLYIYIYIYIQTDGFSVLYSRIYIYIQLYIYTYPCINMITSGPFKSLDPPLSYVEITQLLASYMCNCSQLSNFGAHYGEIQSQLCRRASDDQHMAAYQLRIAIAPIADLYQPSFAIGLVATICGGKGGVTPPVHCCIDRPS